MPPEMPDFSELVRLHAEYLEARRRLELTQWTPPPKSGTCPDDPEELCKAINEWMKQFYLWALKVEDRLPGGPGSTPPPPPPPFK